MKGRKLLMIPGPVEFDPAVLAAMSEPTESHVSPDFIRSFGRALDMLKQVFLAPGGQPFVVAGSGTLAMEMAAANLLEPGDKVLVVSAGYFGLRYRDLLARCEAQVTCLEAPVGDTPDLEQVEAELRRGGYKLLVATHVDTSTAVRSDARSLAGLARQYGALFVLDGVAAAAGEELRQEEWGVDVYLTASQKAVGVPPGMALLVAGPRAMQAFQGRKAPVRGYYLDFANWLPVMQAYQAGQPAYFGTPPVNLVRALEVSLEQILAEGMEARFKRHACMGQAFRAGLQALDLRMLPVRESLAASTLSAVYYPQGVDARLLAEVSRRGAILAGGLLPAIRAQYFRVGHMGASGSSDLLATLGALEGGLAALGWKFPAGAGLAAAQQSLLASA